MESSNDRPERWKNTLGKRAAVTRLPRLCMWSRKRLRHQTDNGDKRCVTASHWRRTPRSNVGSKDTRSTCSRLRVSHRRSSSLCLCCLDFRVSGCGLGEPGVASQPDKMVVFFCRFAAPWPRSTRGLIERHGNSKKADTFLTPSWWGLGPGATYLQSTNVWFSLCWLATPCPPWAVLATQATNRHTKSRQPRHSEDDPR